MRNKIRKGIKRIRGNKDATVLLTNFGYLSALQIAGYIFPIITLPYLARVIGVDSFGKIAFASAIIVWFQTIADWGFNFTATRDVAQNRDDKEKVSEIFSNVLWARCLLMVVSFILLLIALFLVPKFRENQTIILISFLIVPGHIMFPDWFFQAMERMKYITILNVLSKLLFTIAVFVFIKEKSDFILQPLFTSLGFLVSGSIAMYLILGKWKIKLKRPSFSAILNTIKGSTDVFFNNILPNFYNSFSVLLLGFWGGPVANGLLDASRRFTSIAHQFMNIISRAFFPFLSRRIDKHDLFVKINVVIASIGSILLFLLAPTLIKLFFTPEFHDAILALRITSVSIILIALSRVYGTNYMIIEGFEKELRNITFRGTIIGFLISFPLIYYLNFIGAALTLTITQAIMAFTIMHKAVKIKKNKQQTITL